MKKKITSISITLFLLFTIFFLIWLILANNFYGVHFKEMNENEEIHKKLIEKINVDEGEFLNKFSLSDVTYISSIIKNNESYYVWYDKNLTILDEKKCNTYDETLIKMKCNELNLDNCLIEFGYYKDKPMIVVENSETEVCLDYDTLDVKLVYEKKVVQ